MICVDSYSRLMWNKHVSLDSKLPKLPKQYMEFFPDSRRWFFASILLWITSQC